MRTKPLPWQGSAFLLLFATSIDLKAYCLKSNLPNVFLSLISQTRAAASEGRGHFDVGASERETES